MTEQTDHYTLNDTLYVVNADGAGAIRIADDGTSPSWSPDGRKIAFVHYSSGNPSGVFIVKTDGTGRAQVANSLGYSLPSWSPGS